SELVETLVARSDGVPLFAEELTRLMTDAAGPGGPGGVPAALPALLAVRPHRLGPARRVAQIAATIGREFSYGLLEAIAGPTVPDLDEALARLAHDELVHAGGFPPDAPYVFRHALIRDAAYGSLLKSHRRELHLAIARALTDRLPARGDAIPGRLAAHFP